MKDKPTSTGMDVESVIGKVKQAILAAEIQRENDPTALQLESLDLTLKAFAETEVGGEVKIKIPLINLEIGMGSSLTQQETQTIEINLKPPEMLKAERREAIRKEIDLKSSLADAINIIRDGIKAAAAGEPEFVLDKATVELNFVVTEKGEITVVAKGSQVFETTNGLKLTLTRPKLRRGARDRVRWV